MKYNLFLILLLNSIILNAQNVTNQISGKYVSENKSTLYQDFEFDNNGKVFIAGMSNGDYFIKGDTLIIFPDKSMFKFLIKNNVLYGVSEWVKNGKWVRNKEKVIDNRKDNTIAQKNAELLNEFYEKTRMQDNQLKILFDENLQNEYLKTIENLCDRGLVRACKEYFGMETLSLLGGIEQVLENGNKNEVTENPKLMKIAENVIKIDPAEGYNLLFLYYTITKQTEKANEASEKAISFGNKETILTKMNMELANSSNDLETQNENQSLNKNSFEPISISALRLFNKSDFSVIEGDYIKSTYGFKLIDKTSSIDVEIRDYENDKFNIITKFQYDDSKKNRIEYTTKDFDEIKSFKEELSRYIRTDSKDMKNETIMEDYKQENKLGKGYIEKCHVQIQYPPQNKPNEPITVILFE